MGIFWMLCFRRATETACVVKAILDNIRKKEDEQEAKTGSCSKSFQLCCWPRSCGFPASLSGCFCCHLQRFWDSPSFCFKGYALCRRRHCDLKSSVPPFWLPGDHFGTSGASREHVGATLEDHGSSRMHTSWFGTGFSLVLGCFCDLLLRAF